MGVGFDPYTLNLDINPKQELLPGGGAVVGPGVVGGAGGFVLPGLGGVFV